jgi:SAM-dependent methyltransferase
MLSSIAPPPEASSDPTTETTTEEVKCPVCANPCVGAPVYHYTIEQAAAHFCPPTRNLQRNQRLQDCIGGLWEGKDCLILRCDRCGFGFGHPFVGGDENFYSILHEEKSYPSWRWDYDVAVGEAIEKFSEGKVLDIGAGVGMFLRRLSNRWKCFAVEGSEVTRGELEASKITVFRDLGQAARSDAGTFQVVTLFQVLEHIAEFDQVLDQCRKLLAPGGRLVVTVPDGDAMIRQERVTGCADMPPNHICKWTPRSLTRVLTRIGFECSEAIYEPPSWNSLKANLHMRVSADAADYNSIAAQAYRLRSRPVRITALSLLAGPALLRMLPVGRQLLAGGAFGIIGINATATNNELRNA